MSKREMTREEGEAFQRMAMQGQKKLTKKEWAEFFKGVGFSMAESGMRDLQRMAKDNPELQHVAQMLAIAGNPREQHAKKVAADFAKTAAARETTAGMKARRIAARALYDKLAPRGSSQVVSTRAVRKVCAEFGYEKSYLQKLLKPSERKKDER